MPFFSSRVFVAGIASLALHAWVLSTVVGFTRVKGAPTPSAVGSSLRLVAVAVDPIVAPTPTAVDPPTRPTPGRIDRSPRPVRAQVVNTPEAVPLAPIAQSAPAIFTVPQYRVALAFAARRSIANTEPLSAPDVTINSMRATVRLEFDGAGELIDVHLREPDVDAQLAAHAITVARRAAHALPVPFGLRGRAFQVDLVIAIVGETTQAAR